MRVATWNCQTGLDSNWDVVKKLDADVLTVQECGPDTRTQAEDRGWRCEYQPGRWGKGVAVLARSLYEVEREYRDPSDTFSGSTLITGPDGFRFRFVGFWAMTPKSVGQSNTRQARVLIDQLPDDDLPTVIAGDFNASRSEAHIANVRRLRERGLVNAYHKLNPDARPGQEEMPTSYFLWNPSRRYHMDFVFVPEAWPIRSVDVGAFKDYTMRGLSDHVPVIVSIDLP